ncbi:hypothetical protein B0H10DRAFT_2229075 [Mycena sp. CBHHK59/15]|nr:hypothetical protein B0H10DRAFT_2229075 [Mycena sp. CBHHK59/15]
MAPKDVRPAPRPLKKTKGAYRRPIPRVPANFPAPPFQRPRSSQIAQESDGEEDELDVELSRSPPIKVSSRGRRRSFTPPPIAHTRAPSSASPRSSPEPEVSPFPPIVAPRPLCPSVADLNRLRDAAEQRV